MILLDVIGIFCILIHYSGCSPNIHTPHGYMTHYYYNRKHVQVNDSLVLELTNRFLPDSRKDFLTCDIKIVTSPSRKILVHFLSLEISDDEKDLDRLHVYDYNSDSTQIRISPPQGLYGVYDKYYSGLAGGVSDYVSSGNTMKLDYQGKPTLAYDGFKILITSFKEFRGDCGIGYIRCNRRSICIPASTWCDGFNNCGSNDVSDETNCDQGRANLWNPWDGQVTAVVAAAVSCTVFLLTAAVIMLVIMRINKRETITANITVEFRKKKKAKHRPSNGELLTRLYAPPSYEVVVGMDEDPPPYKAVEYDTDTDDDDDCVSVEHVTLNSETAIPNEAHIASNGSNARVCVTSALVTCDIEGNNVCTVGVDVNEEDSDSKRHEEFQELTNYKLCSTALGDNPCSNRRNVQFQATDNIDQIEVISSADSDSSKDENSNSHNDKEKLSNGNVQTLTCNGHVGNTMKCNDHSKAMLTISPSKSEAETIEYIESD